MRCPRPLRCALLVAGLLAAAVAGCSTAPPRTLDDALGSVEAAKDPAPWRLAIAPVEVRLSAALGPTDTASEYWAPVPVDAGAVRGFVTRAASESKGFTRVGFIDALSFWERAPTSSEALASERDASGRGGPGGGGAPPAAATAKPAASKYTTPPALPVPASLTARLAFPVATPPAEGYVTGAYFERDDDLLLSTRVVRHAVRYVERAGVYPANLLLVYIWWVWPAWLVADETYEADFELEVELRAISADRAVWTKRYRSTPRLDLDSFDRGWMFTGQITVPGWLEAENYREAGKHLLPLAYNEVAAAIKRDLAAAPLPRAEQVKRGLRQAAEGISEAAAATMTATSVTSASVTTTAGAGTSATVTASAPSSATETARRATPPPSREEIEAGLPATFLLCFGVSKIKSSSQPPAPRYASEEAESISRVGLDRSRGGLPERNVSVLVDSRAKYARGCIRDTIVFDLRRFAARARERDTLVVYFAGLGFATGEDLHLVPFDYVPSNPMLVTLSLSEIDAILGRCAARQALVLDASFDGDAAAGEAARTVPRALLAKVPSPAPAGEAGSALVQQRLEAFAAKHPRRSVVTAGGPGEAVPEVSPVPEDQKGLFTARLLAALAAPGVDANRDGAIDLGEAFALARRETVRVSSSAGTAQTPSLYPAQDGAERAAKVVLARPRLVAATSGSGSPR